MDEDGATADAGGEAPANAAGAAPADTAAPATQPAPESAAQGQQGQDFGLPSLAGIDTPEQGADASTTPPEADSGDDAGQARRGSQVRHRAHPDGRGPKARPPSRRQLLNRPSPPRTPQTSVADVALDLKPGSAEQAGAKGLIPIPAPKPLAP